MPSEFGTNGLKKTEGPNSLPAPSGQRHLPLEPRRGPARPPQPRRIPSLARSRPHPRPRPALGRGPAARCRLRHAPCRHAVRPPAHGGRPLSACYPCSRPGTRKRALLESNPPSNTRPGTHRQLTPRVPGPSPTPAPAPSLSIDSSMPQKTPGVRGLAPIRANLIAELLSCIVVA